MRDGNSDTKASAPGSLPSRTLVVTSQAEAALTNTSEANEAISERAFRDNRGSSSVHQRRAWDLGAVFIELMHPRYSDRRRYRLD